MAELEAECEFDERNSGGILPAVTCYMIADMHTITSSRMHAHHQPDKVIVNVLPYLSSRVADISTI